MRYIGVIILLSLIAICSFGQPSLVATKGFATNYLQWDGVLNGQMPVWITLNIENNEASGYIEYGANKDRYDLLGEIDGELLSIYQYDDFSKVMGKITADLGNPSHNWMWSNEAKTSIKPLQPKYNRNIILLLESERDELFVRPNTRSINSMDWMDNLMWSTYDCIDQNCTSRDTGSDARNAHEFEWDDSEMLTIDVGNQRYNGANHLKYGSESYHDSRIAYNFYYPILESEKFDGWIEKQMSTCRTSYNTYRDRAGEDTDQQSFIGDFYISALGDHITSGYLYWSCDNSASVVTAPFIYDSERSKFYEIADLLRSDFDYAFFLEQYLKKEKKQSLSDEEHIIRNALKKKHFKHYVLSHKGIVFFTDFNTLFGRRSILVPYKEIQGFVDNKTVANYFNKKA